MSDFTDLLQQHLSDMQGAYSKRYGTAYGPATPAPSYESTLQSAMYPGMGGGAQGMQRAQQRQTAFDNAPASSNAYGFHPPVPRFQMFSPTDNDRPLQTMAQEPNGTVMTPPAMPQPQMAGAGSFGSASSGPDASGGVSMRRRSFSAY